MVLTHGRGELRRVSSSELAVRLMGLVGSDFAHDVFGVCQKSALEFLEYRK